MKNYLLCLIIFFTSTYVFSQAPPNNGCAAAITLPVGSVCSPTAGTLYGATLQTSIGSCTNQKDVWYKFTVPAYVVSGAPVTITVARTNTGTTNLTNTNTSIELFSAISNTTTCTGTTAVAGGCQNISASRKYTNLAAGNTYYIRVSTSVATPNASATFTICVVATPSSRMNEVFKQTILSPGSGINQLNDPWEVTYGPDGNLWVTEAKGYKVYKIDPDNGTKTMVLNLQNDAPATGTPAIDTLRRNITTAWPGWPQGGFAGLAIHPKFTNPDSAFVYVGYVHRYLSTAASSGGIFYRNFIIRWKYNGSALTSPAIICDTLPGSGDHNSQRMIIAPVTKGGPNYLFYASGDMGAGQFSNRNRPMNAQSPNFYDGKILRFNLDSDEDAGKYDQWIPDDNPYNSSLGKESAVWSLGIRNNQGFAYDTALNILYGSSHGPYSDDELNIIEGYKNYGHPLVIGFSTDGNYNGTSNQPANTSITAGATYQDGSGISTCPPIVNEQSNVTTINSVDKGAYKDPFFSGYAAPNSTIASIWSTNTPQNNATAGGWPSEAWSGMDLYTHSLIPGWHKSLVIGSLKWGRIIRMRMRADGQKTINNDSIVVNDTVIYFGSQNRYRDLAFAPNGKDIFIVMDKSSTTSGPSAANPVAPACAGCLIKYTFLGYADNAGKSSIPVTIDVAPGKNNVCDSVNAITINAANGNNNLWVPLTDTNSNIVAEINAQGQNLGRVTASLYHHATTVRNKNGKKYLDRNITITPETQPGGDVKIRLYVTKAEYDALKNTSGSGITDASNMKIFKNSDPCSTGMNTKISDVTMDFTTETFGANAYVLQGTINSFSTFYFGSADLITLPLNLLTFKGALQNNSTLLQWKTANETNTSHFVVERSIDGISFGSLGTVAAIGNNTTESQYSYTDNEVTNLSSTTIYYRLKMTDTNGQYTYSQIVTIYLADITGRIVISPNPAKHEAKVMISAIFNGKTKWKLMDNSGRVVMQDVIHLNRGNNNFTINLSSLSGGLYYLNISGAGINENVKLQKL